MGMLYFSGPTAGWLGKALLAAANAALPLEGTAVKVRGGKLQDLKPKKKRRR